MTAILSYQQWVNICVGDECDEQVYNVLASWQADAYKYQKRITELKVENAKVEQAYKELAQFIEKHNTLRAHATELLRIRGIHDYKVEEEL